MTIDINKLKEELGLGDLAKSLEGLTAAQKAAAQQSVDEAEKARQKKFAAVQKEHQQKKKVEIKS